MQIIRTGTWVVALALLLVFSAFNWVSVPVRVWEGLVVDTKLPALLLLAFLLGLVPMWLVSKAGRWRLKRRIAALENAVRAASSNLAAPLSGATITPNATRLDAEAAEAHAHGTPPHADLANGH